MVIFLLVYTLYDSIFEYLIKFLRIVGNVIKFNQMFVIAKDGLYLIDL